MATEYEKLREKVARAIARRSHDDLPWDVYIPDAEAAMSTIYEALSKPTPEMCRAGEKYFSTYDRFTAALAASPLNGGRDE